jgi:hypothetical protein
MPGPAAFAVLSQHVLCTLPASLARRENLLRALVVCAAQAELIHPQHTTQSSEFRPLAPLLPRRRGLPSTLNAGNP